MIDKTTNVPLYKQIHDELKEKILSGEYGNGEFLPSERELSSTYKVERATTRKALDLLAKERLLQKIPGAGTKVSRGAPQEAANVDCNTIAFILPGNAVDKITQPFIANLFYNLEQECKRKNYSIFYANLHGNDDLPDIILRKNVKGIIWVSNVGNEFVYKAKELGIPSVFVSHYLRGFTSVLVDNADGSCEAVGFLIRCGHKNIAFIGGVEGYLNNTERFEGLKRAMRDAGLDMKKQYTRSGDWTFEGGYSTMKELLNWPEKPTAVFAANDMMALGAVKAAADAGFSVPEDISVVGFDNIEQCGHSSPSLTTVGADVGLIAKQTLKSLLELIADPGAPAVKIVIPVELFTRGSVKEI